MGPCGGEGWGARESRRSGAGSQEGAGLTPAHAQCRAWAEAALSKAEEGPCFSHPSWHFLLNG